MFILFNNWQSVEIPFSLLIIFLLIQRFLSFTWLLKKEVNYLAFVLRVIGQNVLIKNSILPQKVATGTAYACLMHSFCERTFVIH